MGRGVEPADSIPAPEHRHDGLGRRPGGPLGGDDVIAPWVLFIAPLDEEFKKGRVHRDDTPRASLRRSVRERDVVGDPSRGIGDHRPLELGDLLGSQSGTDREQEHHTVTGRVPGLGEEVIDEVDLWGSEDLCLFSAV